MDSRPFALQDLTRLAQSLLQSLLLRVKLRRHDRGTCGNFVIGHLRHNHFTHEPRPVSDLDPAAVAHHKQATETYHEINRLAAAKHAEITATS